MNARLLEHLVSQRELEAAEVRTMFPGALAALGTVLDPVFLSLSLCLGGPGPGVLVVRHGTAALPVWEVWCPSPGDDRWSQLNNTGEDL